MNTLIPHGVNLKAVKVQSLFVLNNLDFRLLSSVSVLHRQPSRICLRGDDALRRPQKESAAVDEAARAGACLPVSGYASPVFSMLCCKAAWISLKCPYL